MCVCDMCVHAHTWTGWEPGDQASLICHTLSPICLGQFGGLSCLPPHHTPAGQARLSPGFGGTLRPPSLFRRLGGEAASLIVREETQRPAGSRSPVQSGWRRRDSDAGSRTPDVRGNRARPGSGGAPLRVRRSRAAASPECLRLPTGGDWGRFGGSSRGRGWGRTSWTHP